MNIEAEKIRSYRLHAHRLDSKIPIDGLINTAGAVVRAVHVWKSREANRWGSCRSFPVTSLFLFVARCVW